MVGSFVVADVVQHETGLVTVTDHGRRHGQPADVFQPRATRRFKEDLAVLLISGVFILLSATLDWEVITSFQSTSPDPLVGVIRFVGFLLLLLFLVRPLTVLTRRFAFSNVPWNERMFIAWIAPRGIVAVAITGLFALQAGRLRQSRGAEALIPLSFGVVIATILAHGFSASAGGRKSWGYRSKAAKDTPC